MSTKPVSQIDRAGYFVRVTFADESPLEPGVWLLPAGTVDALPPGTYVQPEDPEHLGEFLADWPDDKWPRWSGTAFAIVAKPQAPAEPTPAEKLAAFLAQNPDVAAMVNQTEGASPGGV